MSLSLAQLEAALHLCKEAERGDFSGISNEGLEFQSRRFRGNTSTMPFPSGWTREAVLGLLHPDTDPLTETVRKAYVSSIATLDPVIRTVQQGSQLPEPNEAVREIRSKAKSENIKVDELITRFRLQLIPKLQGLELDTILGKFAPIQGHAAMHPQPGMWTQPKRRGSIEQWKWSWTESTPKNIYTADLNLTPPSPMQWVDEDDMVMLTAQALNGNLAIGELPYNKHQLDSMEITTRIRLTMRGLFGHPHTLIQGSNGQKRFVYIDPWNRNLVKAAQCPNRTVQVRRAFKGTLAQAQ